MVGIVRNPQWPNDLVDGETLRPGGCSPKSYPHLAHPLQDHPDFQTKQCFIHRENGGTVPLWDGGPQNNQPHIYTLYSRYLLGPNNRGVKQLGAHNPKGPPPFSLWMLVTSFTNQPFSFEVEVAWHALTPIDWGLWSCPEAWYMPCCLVIFCHGMAGVFFTELRGNI